MSRCISYFALSLSMAITAGCSRQRSTITFVQPDTAATASPAAEPERSSARADEESEASVFASDWGGKLLAERLPPSEVLPGLTSDKISQRLHFPAPDSLNGVKLPLPPGQTTMPSSKAVLPSTKNRVAPLPEGLPLAYDRSEPRIPERPQLPAGELVNVASINLNGPLPLAIMAFPVHEFFSSDDATNEFSLSVALAATPPWRTSPAPFIRLSIPDPFEHHPAARLATELPESSMPVTASPRAPR